MVITLSACMQKYNNELSGNVNEREMRDLKKYMEKNGTNQTRP